MMSSKHKHKQLAASKQELQAANNNKSANGKCTQRFLVRASVALARCAFQLSSASASAHAHKGTKLASRPPAAARSAKRPELAQQRCSRKQRQRAHVRPELHSVRARPSLHAKRALALCARSPRLCARPHLYLSIGRFNLAATGRNPSSRARLAAPASATHICAPGGRGLCNRVNLESVPARAARDGAR